MTINPPWRLVHCDDSAQVVATRAGGQVVVRFVQNLEGPEPVYWTFAIDEANAARFLSELERAWRPTDTVIGPAPTLPAEPPPI